MNLLHFFKRNQEDKLNTNNILDLKNIIEVLKEVIDPETGVNIVSLGLIYDLKLINQKIFIKMTMTTPACPMVGYLVDMTRERLELMPEVTDVNITLVWEPVWSAMMMSEDARKQLGW